MPNFFKDYETANDRRIDYLVKTAVRPGHVLPGDLSTYEVRLITISRLVMARTMLSIAVRLEAGKSNIVTNHGND
jgi:hypothetical protein